MAQRVVTFTSYASADRWLAENQLTRTKICAGSSEIAPIYYLHDKEGNRIGEYMRPGPAARASVGKYWMVESAMFDDDDIKLPLEYRN